MPPPRYDGFPTLRPELLEPPRDPLVAQLCQARSSAPSSPAPRRTKQVRDSTWARPAGAVTPGQVPRWHNTCTGIPVSCDTCTGAHLGTALRGSAPIP